MIAAAELAIQRKLTDWFIRADEQQIALIRKTKVPNGAGGYREVATTLAPQGFRLIPLQDSTGESSRTTADGKQVTPSYMLQGRHDCNMQRYDQFILDGKRYEVFFIIENRQYQVKGEVAYLG
jgi:hypothetical protein